ncbi:zinc knuckle CX2CX4HX4C containing protein [Tanacetum coccineum]
MHRLSKRKLKIPNLFGDWICSLNTKKHGGDDEGNSNKVIKRDVSMKEWEIGIYSVNELLYSGDGLEAYGDMSNEFEKMWNRYGFKDVYDNDNGIFLFKYHNVEEPEKLHVWVKMCNVPWEAWTVKGISVLASRIGKPMIMDVVTASMCQEGIGRTGFARVLVEVSCKEDPARLKLSDSVVNIKGGNKHNGYKEMNKTTGGNGKFDNKETVDKRMPSNVYKQKHKEKDDETSKQKTDKDE